MTFGTSQRPWKRLFDLGVATTAVAVLLPLLVLISIAVRLSSPGPIFFHQIRSGMGGRPFRVMKFRTMTADTRTVPGHETLADDSHITAVGRVLRRSGLDELPQLFNVLAGQMSIVGPRPLLQWENDACDARQRKRLEVRPGLTGLSQVMGRNRIPWEQRVEWDVRYVEHQSLWLDLKICLKTVPIVLFGRDAYPPPESGGIVPVAKDVRTVPV